MDWLDKINAVIDYIEENLDAKIEYKTLAGLACCSEFHFSRMFSSLIGISLSEYIRRRRLTKAAFEIQTGNEKIIDIAFKYGYELANSPCIEHYLGPGHKIKHELWVPIIEKKKK